jgi:hypothetical protein
LYYKPRANNTKQAIKNHSTQVFEQIPIYGEKKVHQLYNHRRFHETLAYKKPMDVHQKSIKLNQEKAKAS